MTTLPTTVEIRPLAKSLGAEVRGVDLREVTNEMWADLKRAWLEHLVLFFPDQHLTADDHVALAGRFGEPEIHPFLPKLDGEHPEIIVIDSAAHRRADIWHSDVTFSPTPPMASILKMVMIPPVGGDTMWSNQYFAYETLSAPMRDLLSHLTAAHTAVGYGHSEIESIHPVVRVHPETGRRSLFVNRSFTTRIIELTHVESASLLETLFMWSEQPTFQCRYRWTEGAIAIWDNRCTQHYVVNDFDDRRVINRVTVLGDVPKGPAASPKWEPYAPSRDTSSDRRRVRSGPTREVDARANSIRIDRLSAPEGASTA